MLHQREGGGRGVLDILVLRQSAAFFEQQISKPLFLAGKVLHGVKSGTGQISQCFIAVVVHVNLIPDSAKAEAVRDDKGVDVVVLRQVVVGFLELSDLLGIEDVDLPLEPAEAAILSELVYEVFSVYGGSLHADLGGSKPQRFQRGDDLLRDDPVTAEIVLNGKLAVHISVRQHQVCYVVLAAYVNANVKLIHFSHHPSVREFRSAGFEIPVITGASTTSRMRISPKKADAMALTAERAALRSANSQCVCS